MTLYSFTPNEKELKTLNEWLTEHNKTCKFYDDGSSPAPKIGAIGGRLTHCFTPTGIGINVTVKCACGELKDITDYSCW